MKKVKFILTMPNVGSWNGKWSGEKDEFSIIKKIPEKLFKQFQLPATFHYNFGDGWTACIEMRLAKSREKATNLFCGYDWMIDSILEHKKIIK